METVLIIIVAVLAVAVVWLAIASKKPASLSDSLMLMNQQLENLRGQLSEGLKNNTDSLNRQLLTVIETVNKQLDSVVGGMISSQKTIGERLDNTAKVVADISRNLGALEQATARVFEVGKDILSLQEILRTPKLRGTLGEFLLEDLLSQMLPSENYEIQYKFKSGETVDAVIRLGQGMVPVDSKFPLENFKKIIEAGSETDKKSAARKFAADVKKHIDAVSAKYILPDEGTFDFAIMYIPAENVYYETILKDDTLGEESVSAYALSKRVIPASPNSFYAYLQAIVLGLKGMRIDRDSKIILQELQRLRGDFGKFIDDFDVLGKHLTSAKNKYDDAAKKVERFGDRIISIGEKPGGKLIDSPPHQS